MLALISPFAQLIDHLPTVWTELIDRPLAVAPITTEAIAFSLLPARLALAAIERFTQPKPEPYAPEPIPDYWAIATQPEPEPVTLSPLPALSPDLWPITPKPVPVAKPQFFLPAAKEVAPALDAKAEAIAMEYETGPLTILELCEKYRMSAKEVTDLCRVHLGDRYGATITRKRQARFQAPAKPEPTPEPVKVAIATPKMQPDGETPNLNDYFHVGGATGWFQVKAHGEGHLVQRQKKTKRHGWEQTTHLIGSHGCDCEQARKKPSSICCHQKALKSFQLAEKTRLQKAEWERQGNEKSAKVKAELDAIASQRQQDKLNALIREEAQKVEQAKEDLGLAPLVTPKGDRNKLLIECRDLFMTCAFNESTGMEFLVKRYDKAKLDAFTDAELEDLADYMSANRYQLKKANLKSKEDQPATITTGCKVEVVANERDYEDLIGKTGTINFSNGKTHAVYVANIGLRYFTESSLKQA